MKYVALLFMLLASAMACAPTAPTRSAEELKLEQDVLLLRKQVAELQASAVTEPPPSNVPSEDPEEASEEEETAVPSGPQCGQVGPSVAYVDANPLPLDQCRGKCAAVRNTTENWMTLRTAGGMQVLICGGYRALPAAPPHTVLTWINHAGTQQFVAEFWSQELDNTLTKVEERRFSSTFPFRDATFGMICTDRNC
ncbi:MAG: hypothetical protein RL141_628 [Candidatus Parcubacteria bacterium]|jgi:hypothetical protein